MLYNHQTALKKYGTHGEIMKAVNKGKLIRIERNIYKTPDDYTEFEYIITKYPKVIFTMQSAFFYLGLCKEKPNLYHLATNRTAVRMKDKSIEQYYQLDKFYSVGIIPFKVNNLNIHIYNKERMLIELVRNKNKISDELFFEVAHNYYLQKETLDEKKLISYINKFNGKKGIIKKINEILDMDLVI